MVPSKNHDFEETYRLRWESAKGGVDLSTEFRNFRDNEELLDVALDCSITDGGSRSLKAHKLILSAYSPVFKDMFTRLNDKNVPVIYLKGISHRNLSLILDFMYQGHVDIPKSEMNGFLADAQELQIKGLKFENEIEVKNNATTPKQRSTITPSVTESKTKTSTSKPAVTESKTKKSNKRIKKELEESVVSNESYHQDPNHSNNILPSSANKSLKKVKLTPKKGKMEDEEKESLDQALIDKYGLLERDTYSPIQSEGNNSQVSDLDGSPALHDKSQLEDTFEIITDRWLGEGAKRRRLARCKLCSKEVRRDYRFRHLKSNHPNQDLHSTQHNGSINT